MQIDKNLYDEINEYCKLNNLKTRDFIHKILKDGFLKEKYGESPFFFKNDVKETEKDIPIEEIKQNSDEITINHIPIATEIIITSTSKEVLEKKPEIEFSETQSIISTKTKKKRKLN
jgi:hypothetical protein